MTLCHNYPSQPCYRCIFPKPPSPENVQSCSEAGILGPVVGVMGTLMAVEAIKYVTHFGVYNNKDAARREQGGFKWGPPPAVGKMKPTLLLYSAFEPAPFRTTYRATKQRKDCALCASAPAITRESLLSGSMDYDLFCGLRTPLNLLPAQHRISAQEFNTQVKTRLKSVGVDDAAAAAKTKAYILLDVREAQDFAMCHIAGSVNLPFSSFGDRGGPALLPSSTSTSTPTETGILRRVEELVRDTPTVDKYFVCRYGNDSQLAVRYFLDLRKKSTEEEKEEEQGAVIMDIEGGLKAWRAVDGNFPEY